MCKFRLLPEVAAEQAHRTFTQFPLLCKNDTGRVVSSNLNLENAAILATRSNPGAIALPCKSYFLGDLNEDTYFLGGFSSSFQVCVYSVSRTPSPSISNLMDQSRLFANFSRPTHYTELRRRTRPFPPFPPSPALQPPSPVERLMHCKHSNRVFGSC